MNLLPNILILDHERGPRLAVGWLLKKRGVCESIQCDTLDEALSVIRGDPSIQVAIVDPMLPTTPIGDVASQIRAIRPDLRIILHSAHPDYLNGPILDGFCSRLPKVTLNNDFKVEIVARALNGTAISA